MKTAATLGTLALTAALAWAEGPAPGGGKEEAATYVGAGACKKCHIRQHMSWSKTRMASSFDALKPCDLTTYEGKHIAERRRGAGLEPEADFRASPKCLRCHTTGYGKPGGYPEAVTKENADRAARLQGVQCEACHGPGSRYVRFFEDLEPRKGRFKRSEVLALGLVLPDRTVCVGCHNADSPFVPKEGFDFEKMKAQGTHEHTRTRQREEEAGEGEKGKEGGG